MPTDPADDVQSPPTGMFSSKDLQWTRHFEASIPWGRLSDFVDGEGRRDNEFETSFSIRTSKYQIPTDNIPWSEYKVYWCAYGPQDDGVQEPPIPPADGTFPKSGLGSRPLNHKLQFNNHAKRGCTCHFIVKRLTMFEHNTGYFAPVAKLTYEHRFAPPVHHSFGITLPGSLLTLLWLSFKHHVRHSV